LLKVIENDEQKKSLNIMRLSLKLDLVKVGSHVRDCLNTMCDTYDEDDYFEMLEASLIENKPNYFKFLIDEFRQYPKFLKEFLTSKRLYYLYNFKNEVILIWILLCIYKSFDFNLNFFILKI
jgi:hypothetical protein